MYLENNKIKQEALKLWRGGFQVIPMRLWFDNPENKRAEKAPLIKWAEYQNRRQTEEEINKIITDDISAIAVLTGKKAGIVVIDVDLGASDEHIRLLESFHTLSSTTPSGGKHFYFSYPDNLNEIKSISNAFGNDSHVDIRADGAIITVPPSKYPNGIEYKWDNEFAREKMVPLPKEVLGLISSENKNNNPDKNITDIAKGVSEGSRNNDLTSLAGTLFKYLPEQKWNSIYPILLGVNQNNHPPLSENEVRQVYKSIWESESKNRVSSDKNLEELGSPVNFEEFMETSFPEARFAIDGLFETGTINMISAPPNSWKSWVILICSICLASGREVFGKFKTEKQAVLIVNEEDTPKMLQERIDMLTEVREKLPIYFYVSKEIKIEDKFIEKIITEAKDKNIKFIIFDSLRSVHDADENSSQEMQKIMNQIRKLTKEGLTVLFTHHHRKRMKGGRKDNSGEEARGSSAINAAIHGHIACEEWLNEGRKYLIISQPKLKSAEKLKPFDILIEIDKEKNKILFTYEGEHNDTEQALNKSRGVILDQIYASTEWLTKKDLMSINRIGETTLNLVLKILVEQKLIQSKSRSEVKKAGLPVKTMDGKHNEKLYFRQNEEEEEEGKVSQDDFDF